MSAWGFAGLIEEETVSSTLPTVTLGITVCGLISHCRTDVWNLLDRTNLIVRRVFYVVLAAAIVLMPIFLIELPYNEIAPWGFGYYWWLELILCSLLMVGLYFVAQRHAAGSAIAVAFFFIIGLAQHFVKRFKSAAVLPTDLFALGTAAAVTSEYEFSFTSLTLYALICAQVLITLLSLVPLPAKRSVADKSAAQESAPQPTEATSQAKGRLSAWIGKLKPYRAQLTNLGIGVATLGVLAALVMGPNYMSDLGIQMRYWFALDHYQEQDFLPTFIAVLQDMPIRKPEGYSKKKATKVLEKHAEAYREYYEKDKAHQAAVAQFQKTKPTVIVVMDESFADLSVFEKLHADYQGPQFFKKKLTDSLMQGRLNVMVYGGGTCNSEFEFLTGNSLYFVGANKYPYSLYDLSDVDALPKQFNKLGYHTLAIHPNYPDNWKRSQIYKEMDFDEFLSIEDFYTFTEDKKTGEISQSCSYEAFHSGLSNAATYDLILERLEEDDDPHFVFDVTMATHGDYVHNNIPAAYQTDYHPTDFTENDEANDEILNEYLACIEKADDDLEYFIGKLKELKRPVVLVYFGDHQPNFTHAYNDVWFTDEDGDEHARRVFHTSYAIWANYDVSGNDQKGEKAQLTIDMLSTTLLDSIGAPLSDYQAAKLDLHKDIQSLAISGYLGADGKWYKNADKSNEYADAFYDLSLIEYLNFATKV
ncbi:MAG: LTA synthase family protein [Coriobacteriales bacterium]|nr:LTA synthase family protein [Coriobacteriales bacterium]